jgi:signal transduction histidine kinase
MEQRIDVLLIEDDPDEQLLLSLHLNEACGGEVTFTMESADTLQDGLARLADDRFDVVLLDLMLPDSRGIDTVIRAKAAAPDTPLVVMTNLADERMGLDAVAAGAQDFLVKGRHDALLLRRALSYALRRTLTRRLEQVEAEITERRRVETLKDQVLSTVSHELRSPLTVIKAAIANLEDGLAGPLARDQKQLVALASRNLDRLSRIIDNFLDLSRLESGKAKLDMRRVDAALLMKEVVEGARVADREGRLAWEVSMPRLPAVRADADLLVQLARNLIDNAGRYARARVKVSAAAGEDGVVVSVEDDGPGVPADKAKLIFERFVQLERKAGDGYKGTGLGLAICLEIARASGGKLWLEDAAPGARFRFSLPYWEPAPAKKEGHGGAESPRR